MFLSEGNRKCKDMWIFNLPAVKACPNHASCADTCYALKAQRSYPTARKAREANFRTAKSNLPRLEKFLREKIATNRHRVVRIHESGDFFSQAYIDMWTRVATAFPGIKFFAFTKVYGNPTLGLAKLDRLPNVSIHNSFHRGLFLNYGDHQYIQSLINICGGFICPSSAKDGEPKCNVDCRRCIDGEEGVLFLEH